MLRRSDSSTSQWLVPRSNQLDDNVVEIPDQRRLRHVTNITVRNLTLNPLRDHLSSALFHPQEALSRPNEPQLSTTSTAKPTLNRAEKANRSRSSSSTRVRAVDDLDASLLRSSRRSRTRANSSASVSWSLDKSTTTEWSLNDGMILSSLNQDSQEDDPEVSSHSATIGRDRSMSRASVATAGSGSTIKAPTLETVKAGAVSDQTSSFDQGQNSAITLELPHDDMTSSGSGRYKLDNLGSMTVTSRKRGLSTLGAKLSPSPRSSLARSESSNMVTAGAGSTLSPVRPPIRNRTLSTPLAPSVHSLQSKTNSLSDQTFLQRGTFFVSDICHECINPSFALRPSHFIVDDSDQIADEFDDEFLGKWQGMQESRIVVKVWTRSGCLDLDRDKTQEHETAFWRLLTEWDVSLDGLISLGRDILTLPKLPPNSLVFTIGDEYFTAPATARRRTGQTRHLRSRSGGSVGNNTIDTSGHPGKRFNRSSSYYAWSEHSSGSSSSSDSDQEGTGNLSDPGSRHSVTLTSKRKRQLERRRLQEAEDERRRRKALVERSLRETRMVKAASAHSVHRLIMSENNARELDRTNAELRKKIDAVVSAPDNLRQLDRELVELRDKVDDLNSVKADLGFELQDDSEALEDRKAEVENRKARLRSVRRNLDNDRRRLQADDVEFAKAELTCMDTRAMANERRVEIITLLSQMFPIDAVENPPASLAQVSPQLLFSINKLPLPNSTYPQSFSDDVLSSALGYTAQVVSLLSTYLAVPLNYPIKCLGSRSAVVDPISMMKGPRAFPLYGKGVDRYRFDYGVFLLNKDIEQLMYSQKLTVIDLRNTLPNLKALVLSLSLDPSHAISRQDNDNLATRHRDNSPVSTIRAASVRSLSPASTARPGRECNTALNASPVSNRSRSSSVSQNSIKEEHHMNGDRDAAPSHEVSNGKVEEGSTKHGEKKKGRVSGFSLWSAVGYGEIQKS
ncbi:hypothetical protein OIO90_004960 [Microbotryomycetes sp. JL221]|nr:hypothetical protein OIO90_004960 [Microbotryomycetes sp. JL221]